MSYSNIEYSGRLKLLIEVVLIIYSILRCGITAKTKALVINHVSNVNGSAQHLWKLGKICNVKKVLFIVEASQSAEVLPIELKEMPIDILF